MRQIELIDRLRKNKVGKILRRQLRDQVAPTIQRYGERA